MNLEDIKKIKKLNYLVIVPYFDTDIMDSLKFSFENVLVLDSGLTENDTYNLIDLLNEKVDNIVFVDFDGCYRLILPQLKKEKKVKWIFKNCIAQFTDYNVRSLFTCIMEFYDREIIHEIACLDYSTFKVLENKGVNVRYLKLDIERKKSTSKCNNSIGIIGYDFIPNHNTYNQLSVLRMVDYDYFKILPNMPATYHFIEFFDLKWKEVEGIDEVMKDNFVNLYCNFTANNYEYILKSLDVGVPCLLGNTDIFDDYPVLKRYLVLDSDDDLNEMASKINAIRKNRTEILKEYDKFREEYSKTCNDLIQDFLKS